MAQVISLDNPTGLAVQELEEFRSWNVTGLPATGGYNADNLGLRCINTVTNKEHILIDTGGGVMAWEGLATDTEVAAAVASGFTGITLGTPGQVTFTGTGIPALPLVGNITDGTIVPTDLDTGFGLDDLPGTPAGPVNLGGQIINNVGTPAVGTDGANKDYVDNALGNVDVLGQFHGAYATLAAAEGAFPAAANNGDHITLTTQDGGNSPGTYQSDGTNYVQVYAFANPDVIGAATDTTSGVVELATDAEAAAGTDTTRAITPANLAQFGFLATAKVNNPAATANTPMVINHALNSQDIIAVVGRQLVTQPFGAGIGNYGQVGERHDFTSSIQATTATSVSISIENLVPVAGAYEMYVIAEQA